MNYRVKLKIGWSGKHWYIVQKKWFLFWLDIHDYENEESANVVKNNLIKINNEN